MNPNAFTEGLPFLLTELLLFGNRFFALLGGRGGGGGGVCSLRMEGLSGTFVWPYFVDELRARKERIEQHFSILVLLKKSSSTSFALTNFRFSTEVMPSPWRTST